MRNLFVAIVASAAFLAAVPSSAIVTTTAYGMSQPTFAIDQTADLVLHDAGRNRDVHYRITYPVGQGPFPIVLFSHGFGSSKDGYRPLIDFWARHGYLCIQPSHEDAGTLKGGIDEVRELLAEQDLPASRLRVADLTLAIDQLEQIEQQIPALKGKVDRSRIAAAGHSLGAYTAMVLGGATSYFKGEDPAHLPDPRIRAIIAMSPEGPGVQGLKKDSYQTIDRPMMSITGSLDSGLGNQSPNWRKQPFLESKTGDKYLVFLQGARHLSFTGAYAARAEVIEDRRASMDPNSPVPPVGDPGGGLYGRGDMNNPGRSNGDRRGSGPTRFNAQVEQRVFEAIQRTSLAFLDLTLKGSAEARTFLQSDELTKTKVGQITHK